MVNVVGFAFSLLFQVSVMGWLGLSIYNLIHGYLVSTRLEDGLAAINITDICAICGTQCPVCGAEPAAPLECIPQPTTLQSNEGASTSMATTTGAQPNEGASTSMVMITGAQEVTRRAATEGGNTVSTEVTTMATTGSTSTTTVTPCVTEQVSRLTL